MSRPIDHAVLAVRDLEAAAAFFERLGFTLTPRADHPFGTSNRLVVLPDGAAIELLAVTAPGKIPEHAGDAFSFAAFNRDHLAVRGEGMSMLALKGEGEAADRSALAAQGLALHAPFSFARKARQPDGSEVDLSFDLTFLDLPALPLAKLFVCARHGPPVLQDYMRHPNGAKALLSASILTQDPTALMPMLSAASSGRLLCQGPRHMAIALGEAGAAVEAVNAGAFADTTGDTPRTWDSPVFAALAFKVENQEALRTRLEAEGVPHHRTGRRICVPANAAYGVTLLFS